MAFSSSCILFLLGTISLAFFYGCHADEKLILDICRQTRNPSLCEQTLKADILWPSASAFTLAQVAIGAAQDSCRSASMLASSLGGDPRFGFCAQKFINAFGSLNRCKFALIAKDFGGTQRFASSASSSAADCNSQFRSPPAEPVQLQQASQKVQDICSIISVIAKRL